MAIVSRLLSLGPRIFRRDGALVAATARRVRLATLGAYYREVIVDPRRREVTLYRRYLWLFARRRRAKFEAFKAVTYGYRDSAPGALLDAAHDSFDVFSVGLRSHSDEEFHLFDFYGEGAFVNNGPWGDWQYWTEYATDLSGDQERESRAYVELLAAMLGVTVVPPRFS